MAPKNSRLEKLRKEMLGDKKLAFKKTAINLVFGEGDPDADIVLIGEAPGRVEDELGRPFIGSAGKFLAKMLEEAKIKREDIYITSVVKYRPPDNRTPTAKEAATHLPYLLKQLEIICPKNIVILGSFAMRHFLPEEKISAIHGKIKSIKLAFGEVKMLVLYHPAAALHNPLLKPVLAKDFKQIKKLL